MSDRLPPLTALRAFDAAARHMSFAKAADELSVTPAALSFQIKSLEEHLGQPVFRRLNRAVELTEAGKTLAPGTTEGFARLSEAWRAARRFGDQTTLTVTAGPVFTARWMAPRFFKFAQAHPEIELRFSASLRMMDFRRDDVDVAIRFGTGDDTGLFSHPIFDEWVTPVMAPALADKIDGPKGLLDAPLLHQDDITEVSQRAGWAEWFRAAGLDAPPKGGAVFNRPDTAIAVALSGGGVILGRISLIHGALEEGALVAPFDIALATDSKYRFVCLEGHETRQHVRIFHDWIMDEAARMHDFSIGRRFFNVADLQG